MTRVSSVGYTTDSWVSSVLEACEHEWEKNRLWTEGIKARPSELFRRQIYATFQEDHVAMSLIPFFGDGHLLWASDYPHPDSVWPNSRAAIERQMRDLSPEMRRKLTHDNAAALYGLR